MEEKTQLFLKAIKAYEQTIYTVCYMFSTEKEEVEDLYQEILIKLWEGYEGFGGRSDLKTWIYRVSLNYCINFGQKRKRDKEKQKDFSLESTTDYEKSLQLKQLYSRINSLGMVDRSVILLWLEGLSYEEIASIIGISVKNVSFKLVRIKEQLKKMSHN